MSGLHCAVDCKVMECYYWWALMQLCLLQVQLSFSIYVWARASSAVNNVCTVQGDGGEAETPSGICAACRGAEYGRAQCRGP